MTVVYKGNQLFRADFKGIDFTNMTLYIAPPHNMSDTRPIPPQLPTWWQRFTIGNIIMSNPSNHYLPWASREKLCPEKSFDSKFDKFAQSCTNPYNPMCLYHLINFYPCFNYFVRSSRKYSHGMDGLAEFLAIGHLTAEAPWRLIKTLASDQPWDQEFETAIDLLHLDPTV